jgi:hypothetical protein
LNLLKAVRHACLAARGPRPEKKSAKKPRKAAAGQKEMLMPIAGRKPAKEATAKKPSAKPHRKSAWISGALLTVVRTARCAVDVENIVPLAILDG